MCACRCGINVHLENGKVKYIEGNKDHPVNKGVLCAKGSAGIMQHYSPARLQSPMKRVGPRGSGEFAKISWEEALTSVTNLLGPIRRKAPEKLAFFTGRDQSQSFTGWWAQQFGTPNYAAHGGFCSVNMAAAGIYTMGGSFWEFGSPDWERTKLLMIFGVAEDHDSNPIKMGLGKLKKRGAKVIGVNPVRTGYNAIADEWVGITPGTDGLFILSLIRELLLSGNVDLKYLANYTNAPFLVNTEHNSANLGLIARNKNGEPLIHDRIKKKIHAFSGKNVKPHLTGKVIIDGQEHTTVFELLAEKYLKKEYSPEEVSKKCGISSFQIKKLAKEIADTAFKEEIVIDQEWVDWKGVKHKKMVGRPVSFHAMRGISAHSNGFQTCRSLHLLQILLGSIEVPGGFRFKPPYPKSYSAHPKPHHKVTPGMPLDGPHLGYIQSPEDLAVDSDGKPKRIDKAFSWENPFSAHGLMHMVISNAYANDPYEIDTLFLYMANMAWNSSMNTQSVIEMLTAKKDDGTYKIKNIVYSDSYSSEMVSYADIILPDTTYLERHDCISLLDRPIGEPDLIADAIRWPVVEPDRDVRCFQSVLLDLGHRLKMPGFIKDNGDPTYKDYEDYIKNHERKPNIGPLAGFRGESGIESGRGSPNTNQIKNYIKNGGYWSEDIPVEFQFFKPWNIGYQNWAVEKGLFDEPKPYVFEIYLEPLVKFQRAAKGLGSVKCPTNMQQRILKTMDPLPIWYDPIGESNDNEAYPLHAITQRPAAMYHSWGSQNAWLRQIHGYNYLFVSSEIWEKNKFHEGDWAILESVHNSITVPVAKMEAVNKNTVWTWNAIGKKSGAWALDKGAPEFNKGFLINHLISELLPPKKNGFRYSNSDPITGQAAWFDLKVRIRRAEAGEVKDRKIEKSHNSPVDMPPKVISYGKDFK